MDVSRGMVLRWRCICNACYRLKVGCDHTLWTVNLKFAYVARAGGAKRGARSLAYSSWDVLTQELHISCLQDNP